MMKGFEMYKKVEKDVPINDNQFLIIVLSTIDIDNLPHLIVDYDMFMTYFVSGYLNDMNGFL